MKMLALCCDHMYTILCKGRDCIKRFWLQISTIILASLLVGTVLIAAPNFKSVKPDTVAELPKITSFMFEKALNPTLSEDITASIVGENIVCEIADLPSKTLLKPTVTFTGRINIKESTNLTVGLSENLGHDIGYFSIGKDYDLRLYNEELYIDYRLKMNSTHNKRSPFVSIAADRADNLTFPSSLTASIVSSDENSVTAVMFVPKDTTQYNIGINITEGAEVTHNKTPVDGLFGIDSAQKYEFHCTLGRKKQTVYLSTVVLDTALPTIYIATANASDIDNRDMYTGASMLVYDPVKNEVVKRIDDFKIKMRGNSSALYPKKSFGIKLYSKTNFFLGYAKDFVLAANYNDKTLMRNAIGFFTASYFDNLEHTSDFQYCDVYLNGDFQGNYLLLEKVTAEPARTDLDVLTDSNLDGDFLVEFDGRAFAQQEAGAFVLPSGRELLVQEPGKKELTSSILSYISNEITIWEQKIINGEPPENYLDMPSFVDYFIVNEITHNVDSGFAMSVNMYRKDGLYYMGPVWDFDISMGNVDYADWVREPKLEMLAITIYFRDLIANTDFRSRIIDRWLEKSAGYQQALSEFIDTTLVTIDKSQQANFTRWKILGEYVWPNYKVYKTYDEEVAALKEWLSIHLAFLDTRLVK